MSVEANKEIVRRFYAAFNRADLDGAKAIVHDDIILHDPFMGVTVGWEPFRSLGAMFLTAFPDQYTEVTHLAAEEEYVAALHTHKGTHLGDFAGVPPTGRPILISGLELFRIVEGRIAEFWRHDDDAGILRQIGALPEPAEHPQ